MDIFLAPRFDAVYDRHPLVLVDAGARGGLKQEWQAARRHLRTIGFEPDRQEHQRLAARAGEHGEGDRVFDVALSDRRGSTDLHIAKDRGLSSVFEPNREFLDAFPDADRFDIVDRQQVSTETLDDLLAAHGIGDVDFMKVDTQGSELSVLRGAAQTLGSSVLGVEVEVEFSPIYRDQPLFADVDRFLRECGFQLFDLRPCYWKRAGGRDLGGPYGQIIWADALYFRTVASLGEATVPRPADDRRAKILKAMSVALLYGYRDYALEILGHAGDAFEDDERRAIEDALRRDTTGQPALPRFPGKASLAALARRLVQLFSDPGGGWSVGDGRTGNLR